MVRRTGEQVRDYKDSVFVGIVLVAFLPPESSSLMSSRFPSSEDSSGSWRFCWHGGGFCISPRKGSIQMSISLKSRLSHFRVRFCRLNRRPFALSSAKSHTQSENRESSGQQPDETVRPGNPLPTRPAQSRVRNHDFSFKSATKLTPQMVYELNEKSTI